MTRSKHLEWAKARAAEYQSPSDMMGSFVSDMRKHDELKDHYAIELMMSLHITGGLSTHDEMKKFINDFN